MSNLTDATDSSLAAERTSATAQITSAQEAIASLQDQHQADGARIAELEAAVADLQAQLDAQNPPPPPPPPPSTTLIGGSIGGSDGGLNVIADIRRVFNKGFLPADFGADADCVEASRRAKANGGVVWTSYKLTNYTVVNGVVTNATLPTDAQLRAALKSMSDYLASRGQTGWASVEHEPDAKSPVIQPALYHKANDQLERIIAEFSNLKARTVLVGFKGDNGDFTSWETYWRPNHDAIGADHYNRGHQQTGETLKTPAENYGQLVKFAKSKGKPLAIGETGVGADAVPGPVIKTRVDWHKAARAYVLDPANGIVAACHFDGNESSLNGDAASARAWYGV